jgi:lauroyl/myristoyl acyltransferase
MEKSGRRAAGWIAVAILKLLGRLPIGIPLLVGSALLPLYLPFRFRTRARFRRLSRVGLKIHPYLYYRTRLRLALLSLKHLLGLPDGCTVTIEGREHYEAALASGKPVVVLGWHQGPVELLHRIPQQHAGPDHPFFLMTAKAFAPALTNLMKSGREGTRKEILHPNSLTGLRRWETEKGILALMVDQVPGEPEEWLAPFHGALLIPFPGRLLDWISQQEADFLAVQVRLEKENRIVFCYYPTDSTLLRNDLAFHLNRSLQKNPEQYNWSYPKILDALSLAPPELKDLA